MSSSTHLAAVRAAFHAVVRASVPAAQELDAAGWAELDAVVEGALDDRPEAVRRQLRLFLRVLSGVALVRHGRRLGGLDDARTRRLMGSLESSPLLLLRRGIWGVRTLAFMGYYGRPSGRRAVGYGARPEGWTARGRTAGPWPERRGAGAPEEGIVLADGSGGAPGEDAHGD